MITQYMPYTPNDPEFAELLGSPEQFVHNMFLVRTLDVDGTLNAGWYVCVIRKVNGEYDLIRVFDSNKSGFLDKWVVIPSYMVTEITMHGYVTSLNPAIQPFDGYSLPLHVQQDFWSRTTLVGPVMHVKAEYNGGEIIVEIDQAEVCF